MTETAWLLLAAAAVFAVLDWVAVAVRHRVLELIAKPTALVLLIAVAIALEPRDESQRWVFVIALAFSLAGDVLLMLGRFVPGLVAFLGVHLAYTVGLRIGQRTGLALFVSAIVVLVAATLVGRRILAGVRDREPALGNPVSAYIAVISVMVASALASGNGFAATGAVLFMISDSLIAWNRFVGELEWAPASIMATYHLAQAGLVLSLALG